MKKIILVLTLVLFAASIGRAQGNKPLLLQKPALSKTHIAFTFAGDLWIVKREGGEAMRLTTGIGIETNPIFSPDGTMIAFAGEYDGNVDTYVVPATGGVPRRLTFHPSGDVPVAWTPDGKSILFRSARNSYVNFARFFTIPLEGGLETEIPLPMGYEASYSPDGSRLAYLPLAPAFQEWKRYRGGRTTKIWLANLSDSHVEEVPRQNSNDFNPMWIEKKIYFLSDRNGATTLFAYDTDTKKVTELIRNDGSDMKSASAGPDAIVCEQFSEIYLFDLKSGKAKKVEITLSGDLPSVRAHYEKVASSITNINISPTGVRAIFEARGEILTVPQEKGNARNLTNSPGVADRDPAWSPDGKWIAYFSDESGDYALHLRNQSGLGEVKKINLGNPPSFFYSPTWSPDSRKIAYTDKRLNLWYVDIERGVPVKVDTNTYENPFRVMDPAWSPDSKWLAYTRQLKNRLCAVFVYSLETSKSTQITDGMSDARFADFDKNGKYLYFTASTDSGATTGWLDMSSYPLQASLTRNVYVVVLKKDIASPLAPESDEEKAGDEKVSDKAVEQTGEKKIEETVAGKPGDRQGMKKEPVKVTIDFAGINQRILALPIPARNYTQLVAGKSGTLFISESVPQTGLSGPGAPSGQVLHKFDLEKRKFEKVLDGVTAFALSANGEKMLFAQGAST
ncbi:MAG: S41 family peptidase, partial [Pyrinomonadaceae bacterium]